MCSNLSWRSRNHRRNSACKVASRSWALWYDCALSLVRCTGHPKYSDSYEIEKKRLRRSVTVAVLFLGSVTSESASRLEAVFFNAYAYGSDGAVGSHERKWLGVYCGT